MSGAKKGGSKGAPKTGRNAGTGRFTTVKDKGGKASQASTQRDGKPNETPPNKKS